MADGSNPARSANPSACLLYTSPSPRDQRGYHCERGIIYNWATKQQVEWRIDAEAERWIRDQVAAARELVRRSIRPAPLRDSPKCVRCSLAPVCLPDVTHLWKEGVQQAAGEEAIGVEELPPEQTDLRERKTAANLPHSETAAQEARVSAGFIAGRPETRALY
ncbi:MAG: CRISPR-associated protein Cas4 [Chthoniobacterales bacterium]|nr:CRISPR-associated protein Cas4 [Chthoniobacterales bacterium]